MRNFARINSFYNNLEARNDWARIAKTADPYIAALFAPRPDMGWRMVDKCIANLRDAIRPAPAGGEARLQTALDGDK